MANSTDYKVVFSAQDNISGTVKKVKNELDAVGKTAQSSTEKIDKQFNRIVNSSAPLKRQLRDLQSLMAEMNFKGLSNTEQFTKIAAEAGRIKDAISDASAATQRFANDTMGLQAGIQVMQGFAAAGSIASGVMGLFGTKNEEVKRAILKVQSAMAILNGVQSIANILNKDSILMHKIKSVQMQLSAAATAKETTATIANTAATTTNTVAQKGWNVAKAIGKAMFGDFTGLLLLGAGAMLTYALATDNSTDKQNELNESINKGTSFLQKQTDANKEAAKEINEEKSKVIALKTILDDANVSYQNKVKALNQLKAIIPSVNGMIDKEGVYHGNATTEIYKHIKALDDLQKALALFKMGQKIQDELTEAQWQNYQANEDVTRKENNVNASQRQIEKSTAIVKEENDKNIGYRDTKRQIQASEDLRKANDQLNENRENLELARENQKQTDAALKTAERQADQFKQFAKSQGVSADAMAAVTLAGGNAAKATDIFLNRNTTTTKSGGGGRTTPTRTTSNASTVKEDEPKAVAGSLADLEKKLSDLQTKLKNGLIPSDKIKSSIEEVNQLKEEISAKKIELGIEIDPKIKEEQEAKRKLQEQLQDLADDFKEIEFTPKFSSFDKATGITKFDTSTLNGIQQQMDFNDGLISQLESIKKKYEELGETGSEAYEKVSNSLSDVKKEQITLSESANNISSEKKRLEDNATAYGHYSEMIRGAADAMQFLGDSQAAQVAQFALNSASIVTNAVSTIAAMNAEALAKGASSAFALPFPANLAAWATVFGTITSIFASLPKFAEGGIVGGGSNHGDKILTRLNAGEMVLNMRQQRNLFNLLDSNGVGNSGGTYNISWRIKGADLYGTLKNYNKLQSKVGKGFAL